MCRALQEDGAATHSKKAIVPVLALPVVIEC
jgi:hypothetical protein